MCRVTIKSIKDSDIDIKRVEMRLLEIAREIKDNNKRNLTDINVVCEEIFGQIFNKLYDLNLISMSVEVSGTYIAVDLMDTKNKVAYQVTSRGDREKIEQTIRKFNKSGMGDDIEKLRFLILDSGEHIFREPSSIGLENGTEFSFTKDVINFSKLINDIEKRNEIEAGFIVDVYDCISMVYDSGRLKYASIVKETELLKRNTSIDLDDTKTWVKGFGDIQLSAFIPLSYKKELSCMLQIRQHNVSGVYITFNQEMLLKDYFVSESEFERIHNVGRYEDEDEMCMQIQNIRLYVNAHTAHHIYKLFAELGEEYFEAARQIDRILGAEGLQKE